MILGEAMSKESHMNYSEAAAERHLHVNGTLRLQHLVW